MDRLWIRDRSNWRPPVRPAAGLLWAAFNSGACREGELAEELNKLVALRRLSEGMSWLEGQHKERIERGEFPADVDRDIAQLALNGVVTFFLDCGIESSPVVRLLSAIEALP